MSRLTLDMTQRWMITAQFFRRFIYVGVALLAFVAMSWWLHSLLPVPIPEGVAAKLKFFSEHKDEFDTLFLGTSRFYYAVSPEIFDSTTRENGIATHTFNFGVDGMHPPENFFVLDQILKTKPAHLKWVFLETENIQTKWTDNALSTQRILYWHDWPRTLLTLKKALNPRGRAKWYGKIARLWLARRDLAVNIGLFGKQFTNLGRASDFFPSSDRPVTDPNLELGPRQDGYRLAGGAMSAERAVLFQRKLAEEISGKRQKFIDPYAERTYRAYASRLRRVGAAPFFVVTPVIWQSPQAFRHSPPPGPFLSFNNCQAYPGLYDTRVRIDEGHLTQEGAAEFTRLLAQELVRHARAH